MFVMEFSENDRRAEIDGWFVEVDKLGKRRDALVFLSIPGWATLFTVMLPRLVCALNLAIETGGDLEEGVAIKAALTWVASWGVFEIAEYTEKARIEILESLNRNGEEIGDEIINAGVFPWVRHLVDNEPVKSKISNLFRSRD